MYFRIIRNDLKKSKLISTTMLLFVSISAMLLSLAMILIVNLFGSINMMMTKAKTPHFMQMHDGSIDLERLSTFAEGIDYVEDFQVASFLNIDGSDMIFGENLLTDSAQDNGVTTQNSSFDYLLDLDENVIEVSDGEVYVPICYWKDGTIKLNDVAVIAGKSFVVAGFLRDSQMNSTLSSSKRFLVSQNDYASMQTNAGLEYLIEFRLNDISKLSAFEEAYTTAGLEANGPTITYPLIRILNAISDGMVIGILLLISVLTVIISLLCLRFTLLAKMEEDYREIGVMKAIGLSISDMKRIYLAKYVLITFLGCMLGFLLSMAEKGYVLENIRLYMGGSGIEELSILLGAIGILLIFVIMTLYVNHILSRFREISAVKAIRFELETQQTNAGKRFILSRFYTMPSCLFLAIKDILAKKKLYRTMFLVIIFATFVFVVPQNIYYTISQKSFISYMGIGDSDVRIDLQQVSEISKKALEIQKVIDKDPNISNYAVLTTKNFTVKLLDQTQKSIKVELGNHLIFPIQYQEGKAPESENEIALSVLNSDDLGVKLGDTMSLIVDNKEKSMQICGIYSDITNGGKTAKAAFSDDSAKTMWCVIVTKLIETSLIDNKVAELKEAFPYAKVTGMEAYIKDTFGQTRKAMKTAGIGSALIAVIIIFFITLLFMKMLVSKDQYSIALKKSIGFTNQDMIKEYFICSFLIAMFGIIAGILLSNTLGEELARQAISAFGASTFRFARNKVMTYLISPLIMLMAAMGASWLGTCKVSEIKIAERIKE
ncbi:putative ABC transport system permease protein [Lachnotalea glycerini]|uniref:Putative ABC transport system permease protein n=1 Tax=Lachnotalea glycerini TaxID=1763509 RepID=A0A318EJ91_9FIRM|nr:ABC transporter permease [Lachnotalea glycerini]PXV87744.1 putative ABC transport system permease protein [Lachnotalea glycerini]